MADEGSKEKDIGDEPVPETQGNDGNFRSQPDDANLVGNELMMDEVVYGMDETPN